MKAFIRVSFFSSAFGRARGGTYGSEPGALNANNCQRCCRCWAAGIPLQFL